MSGVEQKRWPIRFITVIMGIVVALVISEVAVRWLEINPSRNIIYRYNYRLSDNPILDYELVPGSPDGHSTISSQGLRDREFDIPKPDNVFRIVVLGDSVTYGLGCSRGETYPKQLELMLNKIAPSDSQQFEVLNLGVVGYNTTQIVEQFRTVGLPFEPDLIIYGYVLNDPQSFSLEGASLHALKNLANQGTLQEISQRLNRLLSHSQVYLLIRKTLISPPKRNRIKNLHDPGFEAVREGKHVEYVRMIHREDSSWSRVRDGLADLAKLTSQPDHVPPRNISVVVTIFPIDWPYDLQENPLHDVHQQVADEAVQNGFKVHDLTAMYSAIRKTTHQRIFRDFLHPTGLGQRYAAADILKYLVESNHLPDSQQLIERIQLLKDDSIFKMILEMTQ